MDKYISCSRCKYKVLLEHKALQKLAGVERIDFFDFVCSHCKKEILQKHEKYNNDTPKHVVSHNNSIKTTCSVQSIHTVTHYERNDKYSDPTHSPTITNKLEKLKKYESNDSKESVATYDTFEMQEELKKAFSGLEHKERKRKEHKYVLKQTSYNKYDKRLRSPGYVLTGKDQEYFRFWFPDKDLDESTPIKYTKNRSSTEIIKDMFENKKVKYTKAIEPPNIVEPIDNGDWSTKIAKKYATENKLKCFDMEGYEIVDQNKDGQFNTMNTGVKGKETNIKLDNTKESTNSLVKTITRERRLPKPHGSTQERQLQKQHKSLNNISTKKPKIGQKLKIIQNPKKGEDKKHTSDVDNLSKRSQNVEEKNKRKKHKHIEKTFDKKDADKIKKDGDKIKKDGSKETSVEDYEHESLTDTIKSSDIDKAVEKNSESLTDSKISNGDDDTIVQKNMGDGEGDQLKNARKDTDSKNKALKKSKEEKRKVSKIDVRDIINKKHSLLKDIIKRFEWKETSERLDPENDKVSKIDVSDKKRIDKEKKHKKISDKTMVKNSEPHTLEGDQEPPKGTTRYALSDQKYIEKGWTKLPTEKTVRKLLRYKMKQSHPEFDWFNRNKHKKEMFYNTGEKLAEFGDQGGNGDHLKKEGNKPKMQKGDGDKTQFKKVDGDKTKFKGVDENRTKLNETERYKTKETVEDETDLKEVEDDKLTEKGVEGDKMRLNELGGAKTKLKEGKGDKTQLKKVEGDKTKLKGVEGDKVNLKGVEEGESKLMELEGVKTKLTEEEGDSKLKDVDGHKTNLKKVAGVRTKLMEMGGDKSNSREIEGDKTKRKNKLYYRNGKVALEQYVPEEENNEKRIVVYSSGEPDGSGRPRSPTVLATFDHLGNGVVYDHDGNVRLKYNQTEGVLLDKTVGPVTHWKWHTLNDQPDLKDVMIETVLSPKDMNIAKLGKPSEVTKTKDEEIQAIAMENFIKSKQKKFKPYPVKMKAIKINDNFSLKVVDQANIYLNFRDHEINVKTNIGMVLDHKDIVDTELADIGDSMDVEKVPRTASLAMLQSQRKHAQRLQRKRIERDKLLRLKQSSIDRLYAGVSKPLKVITVKVDKECQCDLPYCDHFISII